MSVKAISDFSMDFLYFPTQEMARFAPFCRSVDAHLYVQWIHRIGRAAVEVSPPLYAKQNGSVTLLCDRTDHPETPGMNPCDAASVVRSPPVQACNLAIGLHDLSPVSGTESRFPPSGGGIPLRKVMKVENSLC